MAALRDGYLEILDKWLYKGYTTLDDMAMSPQQKLRTQLVYEAYQVWLQNKQINPMDLCRRIAARTYEQMLIQAERDPKMKAFLERCNVRKGKKRSVIELYNDVQALNHIVATFTAPTADIEKAKVVDASDWLIQHGKQTGDGRDVGKGSELKMRLNKDFDAQEAGYENMANTDVNITGDVSVVKPGRSNYTEEQKRAFAKRFDISEKEVVDLIKTDDGTYEPIEKEEPFDYIREAEEEHS